MRRAGATVALAREAARRRSAILASLLAHGAVLAALIVAKPIGFRLSEVTVVEVSLIDAADVAPAPPEDTAGGSADSRSPETAPALLAGAAIAFLTETLRTREPAHEAPAHRLAPTQSAWAGLPVLAGAYAAGPAMRTIDWNAPLAMTTCFGPPDGARDLTSSNPDIPRACKAKFVMAAARMAPGKRDKNYDPNEPTSIFNIDQVPVVTDWDIMLNQMLR